MSEGTDGLDDVIALAMHARSMNSCSIRITRQRQVAKVRYLRNDNPLYPDEFCSSRLARVESFLQLFINYFGDFAPWRHGDGFLDIPHEDGGFRLRFVRQGSLESEVDLLIRIIPIPPHHQTSFKDQTMTQLPCTPNSIDGFIRDALTRGVTAIHIARNGERYEMRVGQDGSTIPDGRYTNDEIGQAASGLQSYLAGPGREDLGAQASGIIDLIKPASQKIRVLLSRVPRLGRGIHYDLSLKILDMDVLQPKLDQLGYQPQHIEELCRQAVIWPSRT